MTWVTAAAAVGLLEGASGPSWWQTAGGLAAVFGLLILCLRLLARFNRRHAPGQATLLTVWHLGPRREIQVLRLGADVHYVYRHDGAMVLLNRESFAEYERTRAAQPAGPAASAGARSLRDRLFQAALPGHRPVGGGALPR